MTTISSEYLLDFVRTTGRCSQEVIAETPLFSSGLLDSFLMVELIMHLEDAGGFRIPPEAITLDNLDSIKSILEYVSSIDA